MLPMIKMLEKFRNLLSSEHKVTFAKQKCNGHPSRIRGFAFSEKMAKVSMGTCSLSIKRKCHGIYNAIAMLSKKCSYKYIFPWGHTLKCHGTRFWKTVEIAMEHIIKNATGNVRMSKLSLWIGEPWHIGRYGSSFAICFLSSYIIAMCPSTNHYWLPTFELFPYTMTKVAQCITTNHPGSETIKWG